MTNSPIATKEDARYFTPRALNRIPISQYDWDRLKEMASERPGGKDWPSFLRSLSVGLCVSALFNLIQLKVLVPKTGYPTWVWVLGFGLLFGSVISAALSQALVSAHSKIASAPLETIEKELTRIEDTFEPYDEAQAASSASAAARRDWIARRRREQAELEQHRAPIEILEPADRTLSESAGAAAKRHRTDFRPGDLVLHGAFGKGRVTARSGDQLEIAFEDGTTRRLLAGYAPLELIERGD